MIKLELTPEQYEELKKALEMYSEADPQCYSPKLSLLELQQIFDDIDLKHKF